MTPLSFTDGLAQFGDRLRGPYNPSLVMAPLPAQISEAIMIYQEKGTQISNRVIMQCLTPLKSQTIRGKRQVSISNEIRVESFESTENPATDDYDTDEEGTSGDNLVNSMTLFVDRVSF